MVDLQGSFWTSGLAEAVGTQSTSTIAAILNDPTQCSLPALLADSDILQECRSANSDLLEFLTKPESLAELMTLIVSGSSDPKSDDERLAYTASEIIACEIPQIIDAIVSSDSAMRKLFSLIPVSGNARVDDRRAGHFRKVVAVLIQKRYEEIAMFLNGNPEIVSALINQIDNTSILEVLIMIGWDDGNTENVNDRKWLFDLKFIPSIVKRLHSEYSELMHINASHSLIDMVLKCPASPTTVLVSHLCSPTVLNNLINCVLSGTSSSFENGLSVVSVLVQRQILISQDFTDELFADEIPFTIAIVLDRLPAIIDFAVNSPPPEPVRSSMGGAIQPFGVVRLKVAELALALLRTGIARVQKTMVELHFIPTLLSYFFEFKWNSVLHFITESVALTILTPKTSPDLIEEFLASGNFVPRGIDLYEENQRLSKQRKAQFGNIGHVLRILNLIVEFSNQKPDVTAWIHPDPEAWRTFISEKLSVENERLAVQLGGFKPEMEPPKSNGQSFMNSVPVDDDFIVSGETNFESETNHAQTEAIFDMMNNPSTPFDNEPWPAISFDDQEFHVVEDDDVFRQLSEFSSSSCVVVHPNQDSSSENR